jgi:hypothetical protein
MRRARPESTGRAIAPPDTSAIVTSPGRAPAPEHTHQPRTPHPAANGSNPVSNAGPRPPNAGTRPRTLLLTRTPTLDPRRPHPVLACERTYSSRERNLAQRTTRTTPNATAVHHRRCHICRHRSNGSRRHPVVRPLQGADRPAGTVASCPARHRPCRSAPSFTPPSSRARTCRIPATTASPSPEVPGPGHRHECLYESRGAI